MHMQYRKHSVCIHDTLAAFAVLHIHRVPGLEQTRTEEIRLDLEMGYHKYLDTYDKS